MTNYREILRLKSLGFNHSQIARSMSISRQTAITAVQQAEALDMSFHNVADLSDRELAELLYPPAEGKVKYTMPDCEWIHREMAKSGVTLQLLWGEYYERCREANELPYQVSQFKKHYQDYVLKTKATMHIHRTPGETMEVDWAGDAAAIIDDLSGEIIKAYIFVAVLPYSGYAYVEAFLSMNQEAWITAHVNAYSFFGGATRILTPDNLKTGITKNTRDELAINKSYQEMAEHYQTAIIPTRIKAPRDKAAVENAVGIVSSQILAALRNERFFSLRELNSVIKERLNVLNHKEFQKKEGSRASAFADERAFLIPLPASPYELASWKKATVQYNYHVSVDGHYYSVPYEYIKHVVDVRYTRNVVEVFFQGVRICSHARRYGLPGQYSTQTDHMPEKHQQHAQWNGERFRNWAASVGPGTAAVISTVLAGYKLEQQGYRSCMAILNLEKQYTKERLEAACAKVLSLTPRPTLKAIQTILKSGRDKDTIHTASTTATTSHGFTRGADYYRRGSK